MPKQRKPKATLKEKKSSFKFSLSPRNISFALIIFGFFLLLVPGIFYLNQTIQLTYFNPTISTTYSPSNHPIPSTITIPSIHLSLPVQRTFINHNTWGIAKNAASYLAISAKPGEKGAIILYGHNTNDRFGPILYLTKGQVIEVKTTDSKIHQYKITKTLEVSPSEVTVFNQTQETLVLYTCTGFADTKRFIVLATPI